jgi:tetratricopeptide (TPR) repeat protein
VLPGRHAGAQTGRMGRIVRTPHLRWALTLIVVAVMLTGCASSDYFVPAAAKTVPRGVLSYQQAVETQYRSLTSTLNQAIDAEETVVRADRTYVPGYLRLASLFIKAGQENAALETLGQVCRLDPKKAQYWVILGQAAAMFGHPGQAREAYSEAVHVNPGDWTAWDGLGFVAISVGQLRMAWRDGETALKAGGAEGPTFDVLGRVLLGDDDPADALTEFKKTTQVESNWWEGYYDAARAELALGHRRLAVKDLDRASALDPSSGPVWELETKLHPALVR